MANSDLTIYMRNFKSFISLFLLFYFSQINLAQSINDISFPKADIHLGMAITKGTYIGGTVQLSNHFSIETAYGGNVGILFAAMDPQRRISIGLNYHLIWPVILNATYTFKEQLMTNYHNYHIASLNIGLLSLRNNGFHFFLSMGSYFEYEERNNLIHREFGFNANLGVGFTLFITINKAPYNQRLNADRHFSSADFVIFEIVF